MSSTRDPRTFDRVRNHTAARVNEKIDQKTGAHVRELARGGRDGVLSRLRSLDREWDIERLLSVETAVISTLIGELTRRRPRRFGLLYGAHQALTLLHAATGWSPATALLRRFGVRTRTEIDAERASLLTLLRFLDEEEARDAVAEVSASRTAATAAAGA